MGIVLLFVLAVVVSVLAGWVYAGFPTGRREAQRLGLMSRRVPEGPAPGLVQQLRSQERVESNPRALVRQDPRRDPQRRRSR
jgi:hypothetical protein